MRRMVADGEADALVAERVWTETEKALGEADGPTCSSACCATAARCKVIYPEIDALFGVPQPEKWHPEIDTGVHQLMALREAVKLGGGVAVRFAVLMHDLGKAPRRRRSCPRTMGTKTPACALVEQLCARLRVPNHLRELAVITARYHTHVHRALELRADTVLKHARRLRRAAPPGALRRFPARLRGGRARPQGIGDTAIIRSAPFSRRRASARRPWCRRRGTPRASPASRSGRNCVAAALRPSKN